jgi:hypothetical protein
MIDVHKRRCIIRFKPVPASAKRSLICVATSTALMVTLGVHQEVCVCERLDHYAYSDIACENPREISLCAR